MKVRITRRNPVQPKSQKTESDHRFLTLPGLNRFDRIAGRSEEHLYTHLVFPGVKTQTPGSFSSISYLVPEGRYLRSLLPGKTTYRGSLLLFPLGDYVARPTAFPIRARSSESTNGLMRTASGATSSIRASILSE